MQKYLAEFIGTFFLVLTVGCTGSSQDRRHVRVTTVQNDAEASLAVTDAGVGIPPASVADLRTVLHDETRRQRHGMGLAIARSIIEAHAGQLAAENNAGGGATVWFSVPIQIASRS